MAAAAPSPPSSAPGSTVAALTARRTRPLLGRHPALPTCGCAAPSLAVLPAGDVVD